MKADAMINKDASGLGSTDVVARSLLPQGATKGSE